MRISIEPCYFDLLIIRVLLFTCATCAHKAEKEKQNKTKSLKVY